MKNLILFISLFTIVSMNANAQDSISKRLGFGFYGGIKLPEDDISMSSGPWFGVFVNLPTGSGWSLQLEYNFWKANNNWANKTVTVSEVPLLLGYEWDVTNVYIQTQAGLGIGSTGEDGDLLFSLDAALKCGLLITKNLNGFIQIRKQWTGSPNFGGGGSAYGPWLIGVGIQFRINKNDLNRRSISP
jgi:hypothetical protein